MKKIKKISIIFPLVILIMIMTGCTPQYIPNTLNVPMLKNKGEFQASVNTGGFVFFDPQFAYAVTDNVGLMMNTSFQNTKGKMGDYHKHILGEIGIGYFKKIGKLFNFEVFTGYGYNRIKTQRTVYLGGYQTYYSNANTDRIFLQPNIGFSYGILEYNLSGRLTYNFIHDLYNEKELRALFLDPAVTLKLGKNPFKVSLQGGFSLPLYQSDIIEYQLFIVAIGLHYNISKKASTKVKSF